MIDTAKKEQTSMHAFVLPISLLLIYLASQNADAKTLQPSFSPQDNDFLAADNALKQKQWSKANRLMQKLKDYPLYPYLSYNKIKLGFQQSKTNPDTITHQIDEFTQRYADSPLASRLYKSWQHQLYQKKNWAALAHTTPSAFNDPDLSCKHLWAQIQVNKIQTPTQWQTFQSQLIPLWQNVEKIPSSCQTIFTQWHKEGGLTEALLWQKIQDASDKHQTKLMQQLKRFVKPKERALIELWNYLNNYPRLVTKKSLFRTTHPFNTYIVTNAMKRLSLQNVQLAVKDWPIINEYYPLTSSQQGQIIRELAIRLALKSDKLASAWLNQVPAAQLDQAIWEWRVRSALANEDWARVNQWIELMPHTLQALPDWQYWAGRAKEKLNHLDLARPHFEAIASLQNYYGFLASERLHQPYTVHRAKQSVSEKQLQKIAEIPAIKRAEKLYQFKRLTDARLEWESAISRLSTEDLIVAAQFAQQLGWHDRAIRTATLSKLPFNLELQYPLANRQEFLMAAKHKSIDPALTFAIARQESLFIQDAKSPVGALGIMQLMPQTASRIAKQTRFRYTNKNELLHASTNIHLGTAYLKQMLDMYSQNSILATAAYNAGPSRVTQWLPAHQEMSADIWIETIPFFETRHYLKNVLTNTVMYDIHLGKKPLLGKRMREIATTSRNVP